MELVRGLHNIKKWHKGCVLTIGNFDGVHLGHQEVLKKVKQKAEQLSLPATVMIFEPQPLEFFTDAKAPSRLSKARDKYAQLKALGIDRLICVRFNQSFAKQSSQAFINLLHEQLGVKFLVVGDDFKFGCNRHGDFTTLKHSGAELGLKVVDTQSFSLSVHRVSSTAIRQALVDNRLDIATEMLGRPFTINGRVSHGRKLGRTIGFPTANIPLHRYNSPVSGVYAIKINSLACGLCYGVANIGSRPTVKGNKLQLEVHILTLKWIYMAPS